MGRTTPRRLLVVVATAVLVCSSSRSDAGTAYTCNEVAGFVSIGELSVEPPQPRVGDTVTLLFDVDFRVYAVSSLEIVSTEPLLEGETVIYGRRSARFDLEAVHAGETSVTLEVLYQTEDRCEDEDGHFFYTIGRYHTVASSPRPLVIEPRLACVGDCDGDGRVTVDEIIRVLMVPLGLLDADTCSNGILPGDPVVDVDDVVTAINNALDGCP